FNAMPEHKHLSFASSLRDAWTSGSPAKLNIHNLLLLNRKQSVDQGMPDKQETTTFQLWLKAMKSRRLLNLAPTSLKNYVLKYVLKDTWSKRREPLVLPPKSFNQLWKERK